MDGMQTAIPDAFQAFGEVPLGGPAPVRFEPENLVHAPGAIARFIARMVSEEYEGTERRGARRYDIMVAAHVVPVDEDFRSLGEPVQAMTRNISTTGIALISSAPLAGKLLAVDLSDAGDRRIQMVMRVLRNRPIGQFFETAGPFVTRFKNVST